MNMPPPPSGWPRISAALFYADPAAAIDWLCRVFGFELRLRCDGPDGSIVHSELVLGGGVIMVAGTKGREGGPHAPRFRSPLDVDGANTQALCVYLDDVDAHCAHARSAGAKICEEPTTQDYGAEYWSDRGYRVEDCEGHSWWFVQRLRSNA